MIAINLSKQQTLHVDPKPMQQNNFTGYLDRVVTMFFIIEEAILIILDFSPGSLRVLLIYFTLMSFWDKVTQCNTLNAKLTNSQFNQSKSGIKSGIGVTLQYSTVRRIFRTLLELVFQSVRFLVEIAKIQIVVN